MNKTSTTNDFPTVTTTFSYDVKETTEESLNDGLEKIKKEQSKIKNDNPLFNTNNLEIVQHPNHYGAGNEGLQCIEAMLQVFGKTSTMDFCKLNAFKYIWRAKNKGKETEDMEKAKRYLEYWHVLNKLTDDKDDGSFHDYLNE